MGRGYVHNADVLTMNAAQLVKASLEEALFDELYESLEPKLRENIVETVERLTEGLDIKAILELDVVQDRRLLEVVIKVQATEKTEGKSDGISK